MLYFRKSICLLYLVGIVSLIACNHQGKMRVEREGEEEGENELVSERDGIDLAMRQEFFMTRDLKLGYVPRERIETARAYMKRLMAARETGINDVAWKERGPNNIAGRTRAIFIDRRDATGNTVFAAGVSGGIWKCTNFKTAPSWTPLSQSMGSLAVCALAQDPSNPNIMYAGTGEGWFNIDAVNGNGIWKSTDGGNNWNQLSTTDSTNYGKSHIFDFVQDLAVTSNGILFATSRPSRYCNAGGVLRSADGGANWSQAIGTLTKDGVCDSAYNYFGADLELASNGDLYATTGFQSNGKINRKGRIFRSDASNGTSIGTSTTWVDITPAGNWSRIEIACAPSQPTTIYALLQGSGNGIGAIKKSTNSGASWTDLTLPTWCNQGTNSSDFTNGQAWYDLIVQVDPTNPNNVVIGGIDLFRSTDGGTTWNQITAWAGRCTTLPRIHPDQHNVVFLPNSGSEFIATNDGGIYYTNNSGSTWVNKNTGYNVTQLYSCDIHPTLANYFLASAQDNGTQIFQTANINSTTEASNGGDGAFCHIDQADGNIQIAGYVYNNYFYTKDGANWGQLTFNKNGEFINPTDYDDAKKLLYTSNAPGTMGVVNFGTAGTPSFSSVTLSALGARKISAVKVDPTVAAGGTVWIAGYDSTEKVSTIIMKLNNVTTSSANMVVNTTLPGVAPGSYVSSIDVDPADANHILVTVSNFGGISVFESTNGGSTFSNVEGNLPDVPVRWGMFVPASASVTGTTPGGILLATEIGVWYTAKTTGVSTNWTPQNSGLPNVRTDMLRFRTSDNLLAAATHGRGLWTTNLTGLSTGIPTVDNTKDFIKYVGTAPQQLFVKVGNLNTARIQIMLYDLNGRLMRSQDSRYVDQTIDLHNLASGSYVIRIYGNNKEQYARQFVK